MVISDLNYLETATHSLEGGTDWAATLTALQSSPFNAANRSSLGSKWQFGFCKYWAIKYFYTRLKCHLFRNLSRKFMLQLSI